MRSPLYHEIVAALQSPTTTIIPVCMPDFRFPKEGELWPEIRKLRMMNAVSYIHEYQHASFDKIEWFIRGEVFSRDPPVRKGSSDAGRRTPRMTPRAGTPVMGRLRADEGHNSSPNLLAIPANMAPTGFFGSSGGGLRSRRSSAQDLHTVAMTELPTVKCHSSKSITA